MLMIVLDQTIVNVALPSIQRDLGFSQSTLAWVVNAYLIAFAGLLLLAGSLRSLPVARSVSLITGRPSARSRLMSRIHKACSFVAVVAGILMGLAMIMFKVRSPMLVAIGMYLPIATTSGIFVGGMVRWVTDSLRNRAGCNEAQKARVENVGVLVASGLIAGEALAGLVTGWFNYKWGRLPELFAHPSYLVGVVVMALIALTLVKVPLANAGDPDEPAPPTAMM